MEKKNYLWFKAKRFGWGWYPCTWQGWVILLMYVFALVLNSIFVNNHVNSMPDLALQFFPETYVLTIFLIIICYVTGEKPSWNWGFKKKEKINIVDSDADKK